MFSSIAPFNSSFLVAVFLLFAWLKSIDGFVPSDPKIQFMIPRQIGSSTRSSSLSVVASKIPSSIAERDKQAIQAIRSSLDRVSYPFIECEFPVLQSLNKLGDGSLRSTIEAQEANLAFINKLVKELNGFMGFGKPSTLVMSSSASNAYCNQARNKVEKVISLKDGMFKIKKKEVYIFLTPSSKTDFKIANDLADNGVAVVIVNAFAKVSDTVCRVFRIRRNVTYPHSLTIDFFIL